MKATTNNRYAIGFLILLTGTGFIGCTGQQVILQEDTEEFVDVAQETIQAVRTFYDDQARARYEFMIEFLAERPSCRAASFVYLHPDKSQDRCLNDAERTKLRDCRNDPAPDTQCQILKKSSRITISPRSAQPSQTTISLLAIVAAYQRTLGKILEDETFDTTADLKSLKSRLDELNNQIDELKAVFDGGSASTNADDSSDDTQSGDSALNEQFEAVGALIDILRNAGADQADYEALRKVVVEQGPKLDQALESLLARYEQVDQQFGALLTRRAEERSRRDYNDLEESGRARLTKEQRQGRLKEIYDAEFERIRIAAAPNPLAEGLRGLIANHKSLQEAFKGNLTPEQRQRIAKQNRNQLKAVFKSVLGIVKVFI